MRQEEVTYELHRGSAKDTSNIKFLGVVTDKSTSKGIKKILAQNLNRCRQFKKSTIIKNNYKLPVAGDRENVEKVFRKSLRKKRDDRYAHGIIYLSLKTKIKGYRDKVELVTAHYNTPYDWRDSLQATADFEKNVFSFEEVVQTPRLKRKKTNERRTNISVNARFALFNAKTDKLIFDKLSTLNTELSNYSQNPKLSPKVVSGQLLQQMMNKIVRSTCTKMRQVERQLIAIGDSSKVEKLVDEGVDLASDDNWEAAAEKWQNAILSSPNDAPAHHNLGIYYERSGNIPKSIEEFDRSRSGKHAHLLPKNQFDNVLFQFRPKDQPSKQRPKIFSVSNSHWVAVIGGRKPLKIRKVYPIYRTLQPTLGDKKNTIKVIEVGKVRIEKKEKGRLKLYYGRIMEFPADKNIQAGDTLLSY